MGAEKIDKSFRQSLTDHPRLVERMQDNPWFNYIELLSQGWTYENGEYIRINYSESNQKSSDR